MVVPVTIGSLRLGLPVIKESIGLSWWGESKTTAGRVGVEPSSLLHHSLLHHSIAQRHIDLVPTEPFVTVHFLRSTESTFERWASKRRRTIATIAAVAAVAHSLLHHHLIAQRHLSRRTIATIVVLRIAATIVVLGATTVVESIVRGRRRRGRSDSATIRIEGTEARRSIARILVAIAIAACWRSEAVEAVSAWLLHSIAQWHRTIGLVSLIVTIVLSGLTKIVCVIAGRRRREVVHAHSITQRDVTIAIAVLVRLVALPSVDVRRLGTTLVVPVAVVLPVAAVTIIIEIPGEIIASTKGATAKLFVPEGTRVASTGHRHWRIAIVESPAAVAHATIWIHKRIVHAVSVRDLNNREG